MYQRVFSLLILLVGCYTTNSADGDPKFPLLREIAPERYETQIELVYNGEKNATAFALEIYDSTEQKGYVKLIEVGQMKSFYYYQKSDQILYVNANSCLVKYIAGESLYVDYIFFGWLNRNPLEIGPTAILRRPETDVISFTKKTEIRSIACNQFDYLWLNEVYNVTVTYYFTDGTWTTPFAKNAIVPVRVEVNGYAFSSPAQINYVMDFLYFRPIAKDPLQFEPPMGLGCYGRETEDGPKKPAMPKQFMFYAEALDLYKEDLTSEVEVYSERVWYHHSKGMARFDIFSRESRKSMLYDFKTGVYYTIVDGKECDILPLRNTIFEKYDADSMVGYMKDPEEILDLDGTFYYMGEREARGIKCQVFESAKPYVFYQETKTHYDMFVTTVYFATDENKEAIDGVDVRHPPVLLVNTGYDEHDVMSYKMQYNIYAFKDVVDDSIYTSFRLETCFPLSEQKSYFIIADPSDPPMTKKLEGNDTLVTLKARESIIRTANITEIRLPFLKVDYLPSGLYITGLMLDRPPAMKQFWQEAHGISRVNKLVVLAPDVDTEEACATACIEMTVDTCKMFHFCGKGCYLDSHEIMDDERDDDIILGECTIYMRAESESKNTQDYLPRALKNLETAINNSTFKIDVPFSEEVDELVPTIISITDGPFNKETDDYPYTLVYDGFQIAPTLESETTLEVPDADTENECYRRCKDETTIPCASFSYCFKASNKMCRLSSVLMDGTTKNYAEINPNIECSVFSMMYLDYYEKFPGRVSLVAGEKQVNQIDSLEECAHTCKHEKTFNCRGFEYCRAQKTCVLHSKHVLDLKSGETATATSKCVHYAAKFSADYIDMGYSLIDDESNVRNEITLEECAKACSVEEVNCKSFNYCPPSSIGTTDSTCSLTSKTLIDRDVKTKTSGKCHMYTKRSNVDDWAKKSINPVSTTTGDGYTSGGLAGVIIGTLVFGLVVGALIFVAYSYYRSRHGGEGMTVRFMKADNI